MAIGRKKYMDASEVRQLRTNTEGRGLRDLKKGRVNGVVQWMVVDLALSTGLRVSEMAALQVEDLDLKRGCMTVIRLKRHQRKKVAKTARKERKAVQRSHKPVRETLMIGRQLTSHLKTYLTWRSCRIADMDKGRRKGLTGARGALLVGQRGPLSAQGLQQVWKAAIRQAGLPEEYSIHSARHTLAVHLLKRTGNLRQVQKQLGHTSPVTTANMYADVSDEDMQNGVTGLWDDNDVK
jgi:integrase/recombinase XerD